MTYGILFGVIGLLVGFILGVLCAPWILWHIADDYDPKNRKLIQREDRRKE